jgi:hypothetical protein
MAKYKMFEQIDEKRAALGLAKLFPDTSWQAEEPSLDKFVRICSSVQQYTRQSLHEMETYDVECAEKLRSATSISIKSLKQRLNQLTQVMKSNKIKIHT